MKKLIAIPSQNDGGLKDSISGHFGHCSIYTIITVIDDEIENVKTIPNIPHDQGGCIAPVQLLKDHNVDTLIANGMGMRPLMHFKNMEIETFYAGEILPIDEIIHAFIGGKFAPFDETFTCSGSK